MKKWNRAIGWLLAGSVILLVAALKAIGLNVPPCPSCSPCYVCVDPSVGCVPDPCYPGCDTTPPSVSCPGNIIEVNDPGLCSAVINFTASAYDTCDGTVPISCYPLDSGDAFPVGITPLDCYASDAAGNTSSCSFTVTIYDVENPTINCSSTGRTVCRGTSPVAPPFSDNCPGVTVAANVNFATLAPGTYDVNP